MKISTDFDGTLLASIHLQDQIKDLVSEGKHDIHIVTRRFDKNCFEKNLYNGIFMENEHLIVYGIAEQLGIKKENVHFLNREYKVNFLKSNNFDCHIDDDPNEIFQIKNYSSVNVFQIYENNELGTVQPFINFIKNID